MLDTITHGIYYATIVILEASTARCYVSLFFQFYFCSNLFIESNWKLGSKQQQNSPPLSKNRGIIYQNLTWSTSCLWIVIVIVHEWLNKQEAILVSIEKTHKTYKMDYMFWTTNKARRRDHHSKCLELCLEGRCRRSLNGHDAKCLKS